MRRSDQSTETPEALPESDQQLVNPSDSWQDYSAMNNRHSAPTATFFLLILVLGFSSLPAQPHRTVLTSVRDGIHIDSWRVTSRELGLEGRAAFSVEKLTLHGGKQEGVDLIVIDNGRLRIRVIPTRGMGVLDVKTGDIRLGWDSPVKEVVHPRHVNLHDRGGLGWLEGFNEWLVRCGLEFAGQPGKDSFINNLGETAEMDLTLHGKIANTPASQVEVLIDRVPPYRIRVRGRVDERMFYGPKLELWTEIATQPGSSGFTVSDQLTNHGSYDQEFQLIYHANYGPPLLEEGARFVGSVSRVYPFNEHAARDVEAFDRYAAPKLGFVEQVYTLYPLADEQGRSTVALHNRDATRAVSMSFSVEQLPYLTLWKNTNSLEEGYVTGIEPGTGFTYNRQVERQFERVPKLRPGETRSFHLEIAIHDSQEEVQEVLERIAKIQGDRKRVLEPAPQPIP